MTNKRPFYQVTYIKYGGDEVFTVLTPRHTIASAKKWFRINIGYYTILEIIPKPLDN